MAATAATSYPHIYSASPLALCCVLSVLLARLHRACPPLFALFFFFPARASSAEGASMYHMVLDGLVFGGVFFGFLAFGSRALFFVLYFVLLSISRAVVF